MSLIHLPPVAQRLRNSLRLPRPRRNAFARARIGVERVAASRVFAKLALPPLGGGRQIVIIVVRKNPEAR
jgi:hypothetical protein